MKTYLLPLLAAFALTVGTAAAQTTAETAPTVGSPQQGPGRGYGRQQGSPEEMAKRQSERMTQELGLNADQSTKIQQILLARGQEMQAMRGQARDAANRDQMREQMQANRTKYDAQFKEVLTADQYTKYTAMQSDRMNRGGGRGAELKEAKVKTEDGAKLKAKGDKKIKIKKADK
jgi:Spy/CpxP family protein refolding chaperone